MTRKKILVIGANGFTGRRILDDLSHNVFYQTTGCSTIALSARIYATARRWKNFSRKYSRML